jgi:hypothetical protein
LPSDGRQKAELAARVAKGTDARKTAWCVGGAKTIEAAFEPYYRTTILAEETDANKLHDFAPSAPNLPALIQLAGIIVQPVTQPLFRQHQPNSDISAKAA